MRLNFEGRPAIPGLPAPCVAAATIALTPHALAFAAAAFAVSAAIRASRVDTDHGELCRVSRHRRVRHGSCAPGGGLSTANARSREVIGGDWAKNAHHRCSLMIQSTRRKAGSSEDHGSPNQPISHPDRYLPFLSAACVTQPLSCISQLLFRQVGATGSLRGATPDEVDCSNPANLRRSSGFRCILA